jgi:hypothetical protein
MDKMCVHSAISPQVTPLYTEPLWTKKTDAFETVPKGHVSSYLLDIDKINLT